MNRAIWMLCGAVCCSPALAGPRMRPPTRRGRISLMRGDVAVRRGDSAMRGSCLNSPSCFRWRGHRTRRPGRDRVRSLQLAEAELGHEVRISDWPSSANQVQVARGTVTLAGFTSPTRTWKWNANVSVRAVGQGSLSDRGESHGQPR